MSGDPGQEYFADEITEDIFTALSQIRWLFVIARNSSFVYKGRAVDVKQVARELGVRYVLESYRAHPRLYLFLRRKSGPHERSTPPSSQVLAPWLPSTFQRSRSRQRRRINGITCSRLGITIGLSVDPTTEDDRCHYDAATAPRPRKTVADPIGIGVRVGGPYLPLDYCAGAACLAEISASAG